MSEGKDIEKIKRIYGENFAKKFCRVHFPQILEHEGVLPEILEKYFSRNCKTLYEDITKNDLESEFKDFVFSKFYIEEEKQKPKESVNKTPKEILDDAGYDLIECKTEEDIQKFRKYYKPGEVICTIYMGGRLKYRYCFFAVKKDVDKINRNDFKHPKKNDDYSKSVLAIQFTKEKYSNVEIISRYNHTVFNPNCTLDNNLDNLAPGLKESFEKLLEQRGITLKSKDDTAFDFPGYVMDYNGKYYKYNKEINGIYYCPGNIIIDNGEATELPKEEAILMDDIILNMSDKTAYMYDPNRYDGFIDSLGNIYHSKIEKTVNKKEKTSTVTITPEDGKDPIIIKLDPNNSIIEYENSRAQDIGSFFLNSNTTLKKLSLPNVKYVGNFFMEENETLKSVNMKSVESVGDSFLNDNKELEEIDFPNLETAKNSFITENEKIKKINLPKLKKVGDLFLTSNKNLKSLNLPSLEEIGHNFLYNNEKLSEIALPSVESIKNSFLSKNNKIKEIDFPSLLTVGNFFLYNNDKLEKVNLPHLVRTGNFFLSSEKIVDNANMPELEVTTDAYLLKNLRKRKEERLSSKMEEDEDLDKKLAARRKINEKWR